MKVKFLLLFFVFSAANVYGQTTETQYVIGGNQYYAAKDYPNALADYQSAVQVNPNSASAFQGLGNCDWVLGKNAEALAAYEKCLDLAPNNPAVAALVDKLKAQAVVAASPASQSTSVASPQAASSAPSSTVEAPAAVPYHHVGLYGQWAGVKEVNEDAGFDPTPGGGMAALGYDFDETWSAQVQWMELVSETDFVGLTEDRIIPEIKWTPFSHVVEPFVLAGAGLEAEAVGGGAFNTDSVSTKNYFYFDGLLGAGLQTDFKFFVNLFVEAQCNFLFGSSAGVHVTVPVGGGLQFDF
jgi:hypothetical protein